MLAIHLMCDAVAAAYLGCYGSEWVDTRRLDRLAQEGFVFDHCFSALDLSPDVCRESPPSGEFQLWGDDFPCVAFRDEDAASNASPATAENRISTLLAAADWIERRRGAAALVRIELRMRRATWRPSPTRLEKHLEDREPLDETGSLEGMLGEVLQEDRLDDLRDSYSARVEELDAQIGDFLDRLRRLDLYETALIAFSAGEGWPLGEHQAIGHARPWVHHERDHIPLILKAPNVRAGCRSPALITHSDLAATTESFLQVPERRRVFSDGVDLLRLAGGEPVATRDYLIEGFESEEFAIRTQQWKLVLPLRSEDPSRTRMLFAKPDDRWEFDDLAERSPDVADHLELQLRRYLDAREYGGLEHMPPLRMDVLAPSDA
jgi:arylsulfatase A-like enzyme